MKNAFKKLHNPDIGILLVRLGVGLIFVWHGVLKATTIAGTVGFFESLGLPPAVVYIVTGFEILGGAAMILGAFVEWAGVALAVVMIGAIWIVKFPMGFIGGFEFDYMLLLASLGIMFMGAGKYSAHRQSLCRSGQGEGRREIVKEDPITEESSGA